MSADEATPEVAGADGVQRPALRVVRGNATPEEVAALVAVLTAVAGSAAGPAEGDADGTGRTSWSDRARTVREPLPHGPNAWRASAWPR